MESGERFYIPENGESVITQIKSIQNYVRNGRADDILKLIWTTLVIVEFCEISL